MTIIKKIVGQNKKAWDSKIKYALWVDRITKKSSTRKSPFELVNGLDVQLPVHARLPVYGLLQTSSSSEDAVENRINQIIELDESRRQACEQNYRNQEKVKIAFDKTTRKRVF